MNTQNELYMPGQMTIAELVQPRVTGADLGYIGSITIMPEALEASGLLAGEMLYIDNVARQGPPWRTYIVSGEAGKGEFIMNGPPFYHFKKGDPLTIRAAGLVPFANMPRMAKNGHTKVYFTHDTDVPNRVSRSERVDIPEPNRRLMCISKLHRIRITGTSPDGPEGLFVDEDILEAAGFPVGIEAQFTSLANGAIRRTSVQAGPRGTGIAEIHGSGAQYIPVGSLIVSLAEVWLPYDDAVKVGGPQVVFFDETRTDKNIIREVKPGWRPS